MIYNSTNIYNTNNVLLRFTDSDYLFGIFKLFWAFLFTRYTLTHFLISVLPFLRSIQLFRADLGPIIWCNPNTCVCVCVCVCPKARSLVYNISVYVVNLLRSLICSERLITMSHPGPLAVCSFYSFMMFTFVMSQMLCVNIIAINAFFMMYLRRYVWGRKIHCQDPLLVNRIHFSSFGYKMTLW
jgi:hypothetical protein